MCLGNEKCYNLFVEEFEKLSPYEVDHFSGLLFEAYSTALVKIGASRSLGRQELNEILTQAMQAAQLELAKKRVDEAALAYDVLRNRLLLEND